VGILASRFGNNRPKASKEQRREDGHEAGAAAGAIRAQARRAHRGTGDAAGKRGGAIPEPLGGEIAYRRQREVARVLRSAERQKRVECRDDGKDRRNRHDLPGNAGNVVPGAAAVVEERRNEDEIQIAKRWADIERRHDRIEEIVEGGAAQIATTTGGNLPRIVVPEIV